MKKKIIRGVIIPLLVAIALGFYGAKIVYEYQEVKKSLTEKTYNAYALQYGVYTSSDTLEKTIDDLSDYVVSFEDGKYYVYLGFTTSYSNMSKIRQIYNEENIDTYTKQIYIDNSEFVSNLEQFDILLEESSSNEDIISINNAILSSYDEIILGN